MKYSGSIVLKKTDLLEILTDERIIFNSRVSEGCKWFSFGRTSLIKTILKHNGFNDSYDWSNLGLSLFGEFWEQTNSETATTSEKEENS